MEEVSHYFNNADSKTLALFDVDLVLVQPSDPAFQMPNIKRFDAIYKRVMKRVPIDKKLLFFSLMTLSSDPILIDSRTPQVLQQLTQRGVSMMALTASLTGSFGKISNMEQWRVDSLRQLGIDFSKTSPCSIPLLFDEFIPYRNYYPNYLHGILFVNGIVPKGDGFLSFLKKINWLPNKIIFIDDHEYNLKSLENAIQKLNSNIEYQGLHFIGAKSFSSELISEDEFEFRWERLATEVQYLD